MIKSRLSKTLPLQILLVILFGRMLFPEVAFADNAIGKRFVIATVHPSATAAGQNAFQQGGNAIDAAVAVALTLGVVDGHNSGLGLGCLILIRRADGTLLAIDGRETARATATRDIYVRDGVAVPTLSQNGSWNGNLLKQQDG